MSTSSLPSTNPDAQPPRRILPAIVFSQFAGTSLWFAGNAVLGDLPLTAAHPAALEWVTQSVQLGFIAGTLVFALLAVADRWSPRLVFFAAAVAGALANAGAAFAGHAAAGDSALFTLLALRFATGFFLAGVYPVGMKIAAGWYRDGLGQALGLLVGALVLGTAFPHLLQALSANAGVSGGGVERAQLVMLSVSALAIVGGGVLYALVPDGPYIQKQKRANPSATQSPGSLSAIFAGADFRRAAAGYFGHMWELYTYWAFLPVYLAAIFTTATGGDGASGTGFAANSIALWSFLIIAIGFFGCVMGGRLSLRAGSLRVARANLAVSGALCLASPLILLLPLPVPLALLYLLVWGFSVIGDSPQFSALVAAHAPRAAMGTALTIVNCIGFALTIVSIAVCGWWLDMAGPAWLFVVLVPGPLLGLLALRGFGTQTA